MTNSYPSVSIIIAVYNAEKTIEKCLESLIHLRYPREYEIIVVDNRSTDNTVYLAKKYPVKILTASKLQSSYYARNVGIAKAKAPIVAFIDSDCIADVHWISKLARNYVNNQVGGVGGKTLSYKPTSFAEQYADYRGIPGKIEGAYRIIRKNPRNFWSGFIPTCNVSYKKSVLEEIGLFDPYASSGGDADLCWRVQKAGYDVVFEPEAIVCHKHRTTLAGLLRQSFKWGFGEAYLQKRHSAKRFHFDKRFYLVTMTYGLQIFLKALKNESKFDVLFPRYAFCCCISHFLGKMYGNLKYDIVCL